MTDFTSLGDGLAVRSELDGEALRQSSGARECGERVVVKVDVTSEAVIARPVEAVADYAGDPSNAPTWYQNIDSVAWETEPPPRVGSRVRFVARFLGRRLTYTYELVELEPRTRLVMRTSQGPFPMETTYTWAAASAHSTRMTLRNRGEPRGFSVLLAPFMSLAVRRANRKDLAALKALLEMQPE